MPMNGVCDLEIRRIIEGAFLPAQCEVRCSDGLSLTIHFPADDDHDEMTVTGITLSQLPDARKLAELVAQVRGERDALVRNSTLRSHA